MNIETENIERKFQKLKVIKYNKNDNTYTIKCNEHGEFNKKYKQIMSSKWGCNKCAKIEGCKESHKVIKKKYGEKGPLGNKECREKGKETKLEKYGHPNYSNWEKGIETKKNQDLEEKIKTKIKRKNSCIEKYGVSSPFLLKEARKKNIESLRSKESKEKRNKTVLEKYGDTNVLGANSSIRDSINKNIRRTTKERVEKAQKTHKEKTGFKTWSETPEGRAKLSEIGKDKSVIKKRIETAKKKGTCGMSRDEKEFADLLEKNNISYIREYMSEEYPFKCDFYLPDTKTYIELNLYWTHQEHWFNEESAEDLEKLQILKDKSETSKFYKNAIEVWTVRDLEKRNCALKNKINYEVIWNKKEFNNWILKYLEKVRPVSTIGDECSRVEVN